MVDAGKLTSCLMHVTLTSEWGKMSCRYFKPVQQSSIHTKCDVVTKMRPRVVQLPWLADQLFCCCILRHSAAVSRVWNTTNYTAIRHTMLSRDTDLSWLWHLLMLKPTLSVHIKLDNKLIILIYLSFFLNGDKDDTLKKKWSFIFFKWFFSLCCTCLK